MYLSLDGNLMHTRIWGSQEEMIEHISGHEAGGVMLGEGAEYARGFYSVTVHLGARDGPGRFGIGVISEGHGLTPHLLLQPESNRAWSSASTRRQSG